MRRLLFSVLSQMNKVVYKLVRQCKKIHAALPTFVYRKSIKFTNNKHAKTHCNKEQQRNKIMATHQTRYSTANYKIKLKMLCLLFCFTFLLEI